MLGKIEGKRMRGQQRMRRLDGTTDSMDMNLSKFHGTVKSREAWQSMESQRVGHDLATKPTKLKIHMSNFANNNKKTLC